jgi:acetylornithine deacetylase/succinyl-diaminopimelate desuccinylase-like protein
MSPTSKRGLADEKGVKPDEMTKKSKNGNAADEDPAVTLFRDYLRIKSVQPDPDYDSCLVFLRNQADRLGLKHHTTEMVKGKPIFIMTWPGTDPKLPALLLNSHTDVVPVYPEFWKHDPFDAVKEANGDIYGRGTQDMKSVTIQHIEAIYKLKVLQKKTFKRTIHLWYANFYKAGLTFALLLILLLFLYSPILFNFHHASPTSILQGI